MRLDGPTLLADLLDRAKRAGADSADALLVEQNRLAATRRQGRLESIERKESVELGLRVFAGGRQAIVSTGDLAASSLERLVENGLAIAQAVPADPYAGVAAPDEIANDKKGINQDDGSRPDAQTLAATAAGAEDAALAMPKIVNSEGATAGWHHVRQTLAATNGFTGVSSTCHHDLTVSVIASNGGAMERDYEHAVRVRMADLPDPAALGRKAAQRAARRLDPQKVKTKAVPVVFDPRIAGSIVRHLLTAINGANVARSTTFLKDKLNRQVFAPEITIVDDPLRADGLRTRAFDDEGIAGARRAVVDGGVLTTWLLDCASARKLGMRSTGHGMRNASTAPSPSASNAYLQPGTLSPCDLIKTISDGFYVTELLGHGISLVTGDYSRGAAGFWIVNGELGPPVSEVTVAGSLVDMFMNVTAASDLSFETGVDAPTLRIDGLTVAGV